MKKILVFLLVLTIAYMCLYYSAYRPLLPDYHAFYYTNEKYVKQKELIIRKKRNLKPEPVQQARQLFTDVLLNDLFPFWYGTMWGFYGDTEVPGDGRIACGYFVTTVLRDVGVQLNRVKLAQCASEEMIKTLVDKKYIRHYNEHSFTQFIQALKKQGEGVYVIGLDNHTGFIIVQSQGVRFVHSSGRWPFAVVNEDAETSVVLKHSVYKVTGLITNFEFLRRWISQKKD